MISFPHRYSKAPKIPDRFILESKDPPAPQAINRLLSRCKLQTHPPQRLELAIKKSDYFLSLVEKSTGRLYGFVRVTSDRGLNANLWDLSAEPGKSQDLVMSILVHRILVMIRQKMPGCSISVAAPGIAVKALQDHGFLLDPGGIRTMGFRV
ncbi:N-acetyltransferase [Prochlorococcus sp. MIT 1223]|uniref:N-acetyltransferase n=1 Tax=Prochlorococcus sp. MIT 1223 TaxID=3096217 RepID=UPI002A756FDF|nr:N-acetyltransferase [Prochlorococcus sp. MIT 1223]